MRRRPYSAVVLAMLIAATVSHPSLASSPCEQDRARALVFSAGGGKGSFEAGAAYHLIVHRGCDFREISGNSVGAINAVLLAQAAATDDPAESLVALRESAEALVARWVALANGPKMLRARPLGKIRLGLFGLDSLRRMEPLRKFLDEHVSLDRLAVGREARVGLMSFVDGRYHEVVLNRDGQVDRATALDYVFASAVIPTFGEMPLIPPARSDGTVERWQFADAGLRHSTPVTSYFTVCSAPSDDLATAERCEPITGGNTPPHPNVEQIFVIVTSPYGLRNDFRPVIDTEAAEEGAKEITDGRKILVRTFDLLSDSVSRSELDDMFMYNELLDWHASAVVDSALGGAGFPLGSYNRTSESGRTLPYEIALIAPEREDSDPSTVLELRPEAVQRQLYCGCMAADEVMEVDFGLDTLAAKCAERFSMSKVGTNRRRPMDIACYDERTAVARQRRP